MKALKVIQYALMMALVMHIMSSCDPCDDDIILPPPPIVEFTIVDDQGNSLVAADSSFYRLNSENGDTGAQVNSDSEGNWLMVYFARSLGDHQPLKNGPWQSHISNDSVQQFLNS